VPQCDISGRKSTITMLVDINSAEARNFCADWATQLGPRFGDNGDRCTLRITSPYSNGYPLAECTIR
jgi:hypothetical protein